MTAAAELFAERGVDVPLDEIARRAGVSIGTLYNHFPNRGALLDAVLPDWGAEVDRLAGAALLPPIHGVASPASSMGCSPCRRGIAR